MVLSHRTAEMVTVHLDMCLLLVLFLKAATDCDLPLVITSVIDVSNIQETVVDAEGDSRK